MCSGIYYVRMEMPGFAATRKLLLMKRPDTCSHLISLCLNPLDWGPCLNEQGALQ
jgi:hypothetical protein